MNLLTPPSGRVVDIWGDLDEIRDQARQSRFSNQFDLDMALYDVFGSAKDGHLGVTGCSFAGVEFYGLESLVSISRDGLELPEIYTYSDARLLNSTPHSVSPVVTIDGEPAVSFLQNLSEWQNFQDADAQYNQLFYPHARFITPGQNLGGFSYGRSGVWQGHGEFTIEYKNGTTSKSPVYADVRSSFQYQSGRELYEDYCLPAATTASSSATSSPTSTPSSTPGPLGDTSKAIAPIEPPPLPSIPRADVRNDNNFLLGFFPNKPELQDTAVLRIPTFSVSTVEGGSAGVSNLAQQFIQRAKALGKQKLIIDVSSNPGGNVNWSLELFRLFFPQTLPHYSARFRAHEALRLVQKIGYSILQEMSENSETYHNLVTPNQTYTFNSLDEVYGPHTINGVNLTTAAAFDFNKSSTPRLPIHGDGGIPNNYTTPPFQPEDILIVSDGACSSACPAFIEIMRNEGVRSVSFGGRPRHGASTAMGGTRGGQALEGSQILYYTSELQKTAHAMGVISRSELETFRELAPAERPPLVYSSLGVNLKNAYGKNDEGSVLPLQFVDTPSDCRRFYTLENVFRPATTWADAARAVWGGGECVEGSRS